MSSLRHFDHVITRLGAHIIMVLRLNSRVFRYFGNNQANLWRQVGSATTTYYHGMRAIVPKLNAYVAERERERDLKITQRVRQRQRFENKRYQAMRAYYPSMALARGPPPLTRGIFDFYFSSTIIPTVIPIKF